MDAVNAFNHELFSLMDSKPPISRAKMISITKSAIKAMKLYKHVVQIVEKFIKKCKPEYKVAGLYVVDSIVRQSRHQFGMDKDVFGPRFTKNIMGTFQNLCLCPMEDRSKIVRVLNLWQKNGVFKIEVIQPLLDMAAGSSSSAAFTDMDDTDTVPPLSPEKESVAAVTTNSIAAAVPQLQNSDAFAAVAQLFQSSQGQQLQQMLQTFQQQPGKHQAHTQPPANLHHLQAQAQSHPHLQPQNLNPGLGMVAPRLPLSTQPTQQKTAFDKVATLLDRFDYDDEPEGGEESKKEETSSNQPFGQQQPPAFPQHMEHFHPHMMGMSQDPSQQGSLPPNGQLQGYGLMPGQAYPGMMPPLGQARPGQPPPGSVGPPGFPGGYPHHNEAFSQHMGMQQQDMCMDLDPTSMREGRQRLDGRRSRSGSRSPKRRRSRSNSRTRRPRHRRSRSRDRHRHSPQERREREKDRERRQKGLPPPKADTLSVCSTTLWVGQLDKRTQQQDVACLLEEFGQIDSINMIPPRGCAYIVMVHRQDAFRALQKLSRGSYKVNQKTIKIAWALNKGIGSDHKQFWDVELGVTYIPWSKIKQEQLDALREGGMLDTDTLSPEWRGGAQNNLDEPQESSQNGRFEPMQTEEAPLVPVTTPTQAPPMVGVGSHPTPAYPGPMGIPPPSFPPGGPPPPPFMRPGFNPMQMPPGFPPPGAMPLGPPPSSTGMDDPSLDPAGLGPRNNSEGPEGPHLYGHQGPVPPQLSPMGNQVGGLPGGPSVHSPSGGLLGARPGMMPLQRPPVLPPPHMQRFPPPHAPRPPHPSMPPMPHQMGIPRGPHPQMMHPEPPPPPGAFGMPPPHGMRGPFPPHGPPPGPPPPFLRSGAPRGPEGPEDMEGRPFRGERPEFRDRDPDRERDWDRGFGGGRRPFGDGGRGGGGGGGGGDRMDGRERFGGWLEDGGEPRGGWERERDRDRRDWRERRPSLEGGRGDPGERERGRAEGGDRERSRGEGGERERGRGEGVERERSRGEGGERERGRGEGGERERGRGEGGERGRGGEGGERERVRGGEGERPRRRERSTRWDRDDRRGADSESLDRLQNSHSSEQPDAPDAPPALPKEPSPEPRKHSPKESVQLEAGSEPSAPPPEVTADPPTNTEPSETTQEMEA